MHEFTVQDLSMDYSLQSFEASPCFICVIFAVIEYFLPDLRVAKTTVATMYNNIIRASRVLISLPTNIHKMLLEACLCKQLLLWLLPSAR